MKRDRITQLRIRGLRVIDDLTLDLKGLTVLIGDNGVGKSSILEALELLRLAAKPGEFGTDVLVKRHGPFESLLRRGRSELSLGVSIDGAGPKLDYDFSFSLGGVQPIVSSERIRVAAVAAVPEYTLSVVDGGPTSWVRMPSGLTNKDEQIGGTGRHALAFPNQGSNARPEVRRVLDALTDIEIHVPFETRPLWQEEELDLREGPRWPATVEATESLGRYAKNLPNAFHELRDRGGDVWSRVIARAQLGLGEDLRDFKFPPAGRGRIELMVTFASHDRPLPVDCLSEGQLSYLACIAMVELHLSRSLLTFDEPELHLHPALLARVVGMLEEASATCPVVISTHSDRLLDALRDPAGSVVLCDLDERRATRLRRPDRGALDEWLESYRGLGSLRAEGYTSHVFTQPVGSAEEVP